MACLLGDRQEGTATHLGSTEEALAEGAKLARGPVGAFLFYIEHGVGSFDEKKLGYMILSYILHELSSH